MEELFNSRIGEMVNKSFACSCGREHRVEIKDIIIGADGVSSTVELLKKFEASKVFVVADINTYKAAGQKVIKLLEDAFEVDMHIFKENHLAADEKAIGSLIIKIPHDTSIILAIGSGTVNDIARFVSFKLNIPYIIIGTAPSMDGYASVVSPLIVDGVKTTYNAVYPSAIIADINIMKEAPMYMLQAGFGDILGKITALADWNLAVLLKDEYICRDIENMVGKALDICISASPLLKERDDKAIYNIIEALILTGLAIGMVGSSRPASGEEHHLSHCWEMAFMDMGIETKWLHGNYVGVGALVIIHAYNYLNNLDIDHIYKLGKYKTLDYDKWCDNIRFTYGRSGQNVIDFKRAQINFEENKREVNMKVISSKWSGVKRIIDQLPDQEEVENILKTAGAVYHPRELGIDRELFKRSFITAKDIRNRYGVLQLLEDIGMLEAAAEDITNKYY